MKIHAQLPRSPRVRPYVRPCSVGARTIFEFRRKECAREVRRFAQFSTDFCVLAQNNTLVHAKTIIHKAPRAFPGVSLDYHGRKNNDVQLFSARELIGDYCYSRGGDTELISDTVTVVVVARNFFNRITGAVAVAARKDRR